MPSKEIKYGEEARADVHRGVSKLAAALEVTLGPLGRTVGIEKKFGGPTLIDDGETIAKEIELEDRFENIGAALVREASSRTNDEAGDGTTTAVVLAHAIYEEGVKSVSAGFNPMAIHKGIGIATNAVVENLRRQSKQLKGKKGAIQVATVSANDPDIGELIGSIQDKVGLEGVVTVEEGKGTETTVESVEGLRFDKGYISPYFITDSERMEAVLDDPLILLYGKKISNVADMVPLLESTMKLGRPFVFIAEDIESEPLTMLVLNRLKGALRVAAVKAPGFGERRSAMLEDIAILTGGKFVSEDLGISLENVTPEVFGSCTRIVITKEHTTIIGGKGKKNEIRSRMNQIRKQIETTDSKYDREKLEERLGKLSGGVAVVKVGAPTETHLKERKSKVEDALNATRAAMEEGVVPGGGLALLRAASALSNVKAEGDEKIGIGIVERALSAPMRTIAENSGAQGDIVVERVRHETNSVGYDAARGEYCDLLKAGIVDPTKVVRLCIENAASIAGMLLTTEAIVTERPEEDVDKPHTPPPY